MGHKTTSIFNLPMSVALKSFYRRVFLLLYLSCQTSTFKLGTKMDIEKPKKPLQPLHPVDHVHSQPSPPHDVAAVIPSLAASVLSEPTAVDVVFLIDRTSKKVLRTVPKLIGIADMMKQKYNGSKFGLSFYANFICTDLYSKDECPAKVINNQEHMEAEGCYTCNTSLSTKIKSLKSSAKEIELLGSQGANAGVAAVMMTATDSDLHWADGVETDRYKVIFVITNKVTHCCSKKHGVKDPPAGDGTDRCLMIDNPTPEFVGGLLRKNGIALFLALAESSSGSDTFGSWKEMGKRMGITYEIADWMENDKEKVFEIFNTFLETIIKERKKLKTGGVKPRTSKKDNEKSKSHLDAGVQRNTQEHEKLTHPKQLSVKVASEKHDEIITVPSHHTPYETKPPSTHTPETGHVNMTKSQILHIKPKTDVVQKQHKADVTSSLPKPETDEPHKTHHEHQEKPKTREHPGQTTTDIPHVTKEHKKEGVDEAGTKEKVSSGKGATEKVATVTTKLVTKEHTKESGNNTENKNGSLEDTKKAAKRSTTATPHITKEHTEARKDGHDDNLETKKEKKSSTEGTLKEHTRSAITTTTATSQVTKEHKKEFTDKTENKKEARDENDLQETTTTVKLTTTATPQKTKKPKKGRGEKTEKIREEESSDEDASDETTKEAKKTTTDRRINNSDEPEEDMDGVTSTSRPKIEKEEEDYTATENAESKREKEKEEEGEEGDEKE